MTSPSNWRRDQHPQPPASVVNAANWSRPQHMRRAFRSMGASHGALMCPRDGQIRALPRALRPAEAIEAFAFESWTGERMSLGQAMAGCGLDGLLIFKDGTLVYEAYHQGFNRLDHHLWMSCTKSLVGLCVGVLVGEGRIDPEAPITAYLPELAVGGFAGASVRQVLDMTTAIDFQESRMVAAVLRGEHAATEVRWARVQRWAPPDALPQAEPEAHPGLPSVLPGIPAHPTAVHGQRMSYESPNTDVLGWLVTRVSGQPLPAFVSERIWQRIGAAHDAFFLTDLGGDANAHAGFNSTLEDMARLGLAVAAGGAWDGVQVLPRAWIDDLTAAPPPEAEAAWRASPYNDPESPVHTPRMQGYRSQWWVIDRDRDVFTGSGVHGQMLFVNRSAGVVAAAFAARPDTTNMASAAFKAVLAGLDAWAQAEA